jgi:NAD(P)-dependent dehydrogenase (short-subunit alcohol dehydrogenase family)
MDLQLDEKVAVITGGSSGIGRATAEGLAQEGVHVVCCARDGERVGNVAGHLRDAHGVEARGVQADVTKSEDLSRLVEEVQSVFGGTDILINNAGMGTDEGILEAPDEKWQYYWDLHVMAAVRLARGLVPTMRDRGDGVILHNASICARQPLDHEPIYNVTKAALAMLSKCLANEVADEDIRVNCVHPGLVQTEPWEDAAKEATADEERNWEAYLSDIAEEETPIGRFASPEELADFFVFLCSPRASYCLGSSYYVDGGWLNVVTQMAEAGQPRIDELVELVISFCVYQMIDSLDASA